MARARRAGNHSPQGESGTGPSSGPDSASPASDSRSRPGDGISAVAAVSSESELRAREAVSAFLSALGIPADHPELESTPERVVTAWKDEFLRGYRQDPVALLRERLPTSSSDPILLTHLRFVSVCPHHLLPFEGTAHLAYVPRGHVVGLGRLSQLVDALSRRLTLQETLCARIADTLWQALECQGAACVLEAAHDCVRLRGAEQSKSRTVTAAYRGCMEEDPGLRLLLLRAIGGEQPG